MNGVLRFALGLANVPDKDVADLETALPGLTRLCAVAKQLQPILEKAAPHVEALEPLMAEAQPIVMAAWPDIVGVLPTIEEFLAFAQSKGVA